MREGWRGGTRETESERQREREKGGSGGLVVARTAGREPGVGGVCFLKGQGTVYHACRRDAGHRA